MPEPTFDVIKRHGCERVTQRRVQLLRGPWLSPAHQRLDLRPAVLYRREVRRVSGQPHDFRFDFGDRRLDLTGLMHRQVVEQQDIPRAQLRDQYPTNVRIEGYGIDRAFETERREQPAQAQRPEQRHPLAMIARHTLIDSFAPRRAPASPRHRQMEARLVGEDEAAAIQPRDPAAEGAPVGLDPLGGGQTFFYEAGRAFAAPGRRSRDGLRLWPSFSDRPRVLRASRQAAARLAGATVPGACHRGRPDNRHRAASGSSRSLHESGGADERRCAGQPRRLRPSHRASLCHSRKP
jgi:hypothetical protein